MIYLSEQEVDLLWDQMGDSKDWKSLLKAVMRLCGRTARLDVMMVDRLVREAYQLNARREGFPELAGRLYELINMRLAKE